jgi:hypothetical protein
MLKLEHNLIQKIKGDLRDWVHTIL